jgi:hypothetical protein
VRRDNAPRPVRQPRTDADDSFAFRRSRTITGSAATSVRAAGEDRGQLRSPRLHEHSLRKHRRKLSFYLLSILAVSGGLFYVVSSYIGGTIRVSTLTNQPVQRELNEQTYQAIVMQYFADHPLEHFQFALNETAFSQYVQSKAPEVAKASLTTGDGFGAGDLSLVLREPVTAWTIKGQQYFVDADGLAFTTNYFAIPSVVVTDKSGISAEAGVVASTKLLRFIGRVVTLVNASPVAPVEAVTLPSDSTRQVDFKLKDRAYPIRAHMDRDPAGQAADIINAVTYADNKALNPEYLDVRVSSKAYYRN